MKPYIYKYVGIDPGMSGGVACILVAGDMTEVEYWKMPDTDTDLLLKLADLDRTPGRIRMAMLEKVHAMPKQGVSSTFKFGENYGKLQMALVSSGIPFEYVTPQKWQGALGCRTGGDKNVTKGAAQRLFPGHRITHAVADALLLAEYCRRVYGTGEIE